MAAKNDAISPFKTNARRKDSAWETNIGGGSMTTDTLIQKVAEAIYESCKGKIAVTAGNGSHLLADPWTHIAKAAIAVVEEHYKENKNEG